MKKLILTDIIETNRLIIEMPKVEDSKNLYALIDDNITEFLLWIKGDDYRDTEKHIEEVIESCKNLKSWDTLIRFKKTIEL